MFRNVSSEERGEVGRNCSFKDCLDFFYFFVCLLYSPLEKCPFFSQAYH